MDDLDAIRTALANDLTIDIVTTGAKSGQARETEIWFLNLDGRIVITGTPGRRDWMTTAPGSAPIIILPMGAKS